LDAAAGQLERPIAGKGRRPRRDQHQQDADAQVGRRHQAVADRRPADDRRQRQQWQRRRGRQLQAGRGRERRRGLAGVDPGPAQHLHGERRGCARHEAADGVAGKLGAGDGEPAPGSQRDPVQLPQDP
jgi:hypothetical protein